MYLQEIKGKFLVINESKYYNLSKVILIDNIEERVITEAIEMGTVTKQVPTSMSSKGKVLSTKSLDIPTIETDVAFKDFKFTIFFEGDGLCELYFKTEEDAIEFKNKIIQIVDSI